MIIDNGVTQCLVGNVHWVILKSMIVGLDLMALWVPALLLLSDWLILIPL